LYLEFLVSQLLFHFKKEEAMSQSTVHLEVIVHIPKPPDTWHASLERSDTNEKREFKTALELVRYLEHIMPVRARTVGLR
jgi:hypothetical protein